jgi:hypothetical protein
MTTETLDQYNFDQVSKCMIRFFECRFKSKIFITMRHIRAKLKVSPPNYQI